MLQKQRFVDRRRHAAETASAANNMMNKKHERGHVVPSTQLKAPGAVPVNHHNQSEHHQDVEAPSYLTSRSHQDASAPLTIEATLVPDMPCAIPVAVVAENDEESLRENAEMNDKNVVGVHGYEAEKGRAGSSLRATRKRCALVAMALFVFLLGAIVSLLMSLVVNSSSDSTSENAVELLDPTPTLVPTNSPEASLPTTTTTAATPSSSIPTFAVHVPNTYCEYYESGGDGNCTEGVPFDEVWQRCVEAGTDRCMGVMWNSCQGPTSDTTVNGAWKLMTAGQLVGDAGNPTSTCGGREQSRGHWDVFLREENLAPPPALHVPNTYCEYYERGGDGECSEGQAFDDIWLRCVKAGKSKCMGVMWNACEGETSDTSVNGAWKLMTAGQFVGDADHPSTTCGGSEQALGHWDVFLREDVNIVPPPSAHIANSYCEYYESGGDGNCTEGKAFDAIWQRCLEAGQDQCIGVMWNSCEGVTSDISVSGAWKLITAGQDVGNADTPTATCGGSDGHWDAFLV